MMAATAIVETVRSRIAADAYFAGESVTAFDGSDAADKVIDEALNERGIAVYVYPVIRVSKQSNSRAFVRVTCQVLVRLEINPNVNAAGANKDAMVAVTTILLAVLTPEPDLNDTQFDVPEDVVVFDDSDEGLLAFNISFLKDAVIS